MAKTETTETILNRFRKNVYSQFGEDGILEMLCAEMGIQDGVFCEFGAWDGQKFSNTYNLYKKGWSGVYIEANSDRCKKLAANVPDRDRVALVCAMVEPAGPGSLDQILQKVDVFQKKRRLDVLSVDIDSDDLAVWQGLTIIRPGIVVIEFNPTMPLDVSYVNPRGQTKGNSARAIADYAKTIGYDIVATTHCNLILVDAQRRPATVAVIDLLREGLDDQVRFFWGYDGELIVATRKDGRDVVEAPDIIPVPWKPIAMPQPLAKVFRSYEQSNMMNALSLCYGVAGWMLVRPISALKIANHFLRRITRRTKSAGTAEASHKA